LEAADRTYRHHEPDHHDEQNDRHDRALLQKHQREPRTKDKSHKIK
jgi:hypothetical protein